MAKCKECGKRISMSTGIQCTNCKELICQDCVISVSCCFPFCNECYNFILFEQECPDCKNNTLIEWEDGRFCTYCFENYGDGLKY